MCGFPEAPDAEDYALLAQVPAQLIREADETTLLVREECLSSIQVRHPTVRVERGQRWIRFATPMAWELVGFLARVTGALAEAGVPLGAVCGYSRDHLFVAEEHLESTRRVLEGIFGPEEAR